MSQLSNYGGVIVPSVTDAATIPSDLLGLVNQLCGAVGIPAKVNAVVSSKAERDANYDGYPAGGIVVCPPLKTIWLSLGKVNGVQSWNVTYGDTGWVTTGFQYGPDFSAYSTGSVRARRKGPMYNLRVQVTYNGQDTITADNQSAGQPGNIADQIILAQVPSDFIPADEQISNFVSTYTNGSCRLQTDGVVKIMTMNTASKIAPAQPLQMQFWWMADD